MLVVADGRGRHLFDISPYNATRVMQAEAAHGLEPKRLGNIILLERVLTEEELRRLAFVAQINLAEMEVRRYSRLQRICSYLGDVMSPEQMLSTRMLERMVEDIGVEETAALLLQSKIVADGPAAALTERIVARRTSTLFGAQATELPDEIARRWAERLLSSLLYEFEIRHDPATLVDIEEAENVFRAWVSPQDLDMLRRRAQERGAAWHQRQALLKELAVAPDDAAQVAAEAARGGRLASTGAVTVGKGGAHESLADRQAWAAVK